MAALLQYSTQANTIASATGCKNLYSLMKLSTHDRVKQTVADAIHTVRDGIEHIFNLIIGKEYSKNVRLAEVELEGLKLLLLPWEREPEKVSVEVLFIV